MKSGKTQGLIQEYLRAVSEQKRTMSFKPTLDTRGDKRFIISRSCKTLIPACKLSLDGAELVLDAIQSKETPTLYIVDEAQFLSDVSWVNQVVELGHSLVFSSLSNDRDGNPWKVTSTLVSLADSIIHLHARCDFCGKPANFSLFQAANHSAASNQILIESVENKYYPTCRACWMKRK